MKDRVLEMKNKRVGPREKKELKSPEQLRTEEKETRRAPEKYNVKNSPLQGFSLPSLGSSHLPSCRNPSLRGKNMETTKDTKPPTVYRNINQQFQSYIPETAQHYPLLFRRSLNSL